MRLEQIGSRFVWRDDLRQGGTKAAVLDKFLRPGQHYAYAGPCEGYAQLALGFAARNVGATAHLFCAARQTRHPNTSAAADAGALIYEVRPGYLSCVKAAARSFCEAEGVELLPFGLSSDDFENALADYARSIPIRPHEIWVAAGSGTLARALQKAFPRAAVNAVRIGREPNVGSATLHAAPERFEQPAKAPPPFPSCSNYDAKVWQFFEKNAAPGALYWNVAA